MKKVITQDDRILRHLQTHRGITSWEAIKEYRITRLSACIHRLRKEYPITSEWVYSRNRYDEPVKYARYKLEDKEHWYRVVRLFM